MAICEYLVNNRQMPQLQFDLFFATTQNKPMQLGNDTNQAAINNIVSEFSAAMSFVGKPDVLRVFTSHVDPDRQVLRVGLGDKAYALKIDFSSDVTARLAREFDGLKALNAHFVNYDKLGTATPVYLSPAGTFFAMEFLDFNTAGRRLKESGQDQTTKQVYRRAGLWLTAMHEFKPKKRSPFYGEWMHQEVDARIADGAMQAPFALAETMRNTLEAQIAEVQLTKDTRVWSHGDFHSENIMLGPGMTYGFDLTEARMKLAIYDIVDFLKVDIYRPMRGQEIDSSGLIAKHRDMFFRGYKHKVNPKLFDLAMRGRLLIDWVTITKDGFASRESQRIRFERLKERLNVAFNL